MDPEIEVFGFLNLADARINLADARPDIADATSDLADAVSDAHTDFRREIMACRLTFRPGCQSVRLTRHPCGRKTELADARLHLADAMFVLADART